MTAISTCYTDHCRPRLFTYIVKDYTTGNHFCLAFKTMKRSGTNVSISTVYVRLNIIYVRDILYLSALLVYRYICNVLYIHVMLT